ncbi:UNVERIFIED_CONTAM: hypothetical protein K2H54_034349 [Gekko kuhli]
MCTGLVQVIHPVYGHAAPQRDRYNLIHWTSIGAHCGNLLPGVCGKHSSAHHTMAGVALLKQRTSMLPLNTMAVIVTHPPPQAPVLKKPQFLLMGIWHPSSQKPHFCFCSDSVKRQLQPLCDLYSAQCLNRGG